MAEYEVRSSAVRAAKKAGLTEGQFEVVQVWEEGGKSHWEIKSVVQGEKIATPEPTNPSPPPVATTTEAPPVTQSESKVEETTTPVQTVTQPASDPKPTEPTTPVASKGSNVKASKSTVEKPTRLVWTIADEMRNANPTVTRKAIVEECLRRGIAFYTARTQYQRWAKSKKVA